MTIDISLRLALRQTQTTLPPVGTQFRFMWDDENPKWNYECRTLHPDFQEGPGSPPAVNKIYKTPVETGDARVNLTKDPSWDWRGTIIYHNGGSVGAFDYVTDKGLALYNTTGWAQQAYLGFSGNIVNVLERQGDWYRFETLKPQDWNRARQMTNATHPQFVHRFTCISFRNGITVRINGTGTNRPVVWVPLVTWEGYAWAKCVVEA
jgi:hypothetical protein